MMELKDYQKRQLNIAWHIMIQWLTSKGELNSWIENELQYEEMRGEEMDPDYFPLITHGGGPFQFFNWDATSSDHSYQLYNKEWNTKVIPEIEGLLQLSI